MKNILYIAPTVPVSTCPHAGGQLAHYYINKLNKKTDVNLKMICYVQDYEKDLLPQLEKDGFDAKYCFLGKRSLFTKVFNKFSHLTYGFISKEHAYQVRDISIELDRSGFYPDIVLFDWEQSSFMYPLLKKIWPSSKYVVVEDDVMWQSKYRYFKNEKKILKKVVRFFEYRQCLSADKKYFPKIDEIVVISQKDKKLVESLKTGNRNIRVIAPYYHDYSNLPISIPTENIVVFMGYLKREENIEAVDWFVKEVLPLVPNIKFVIMGGGVPDHIKAYQSDTITVTGYVSIDEINDYYKKALCMVVPLFRGAGTKIKVLEGMSAGLPVLTNDIGIEGIDAQDGLLYFNCNEAMDYVQVINRLTREKKLRVKIGTAARNHIKDNFDYTKCDYIEL